MSTPAAIHMAKVTYRRVRVDFWRHPKTAERLTADELLLHLRLATGGHAACIERVSARMLAHELGTDMTEDRVFRALEALDAYGIVRWDRDRDVIWLIEGLDEQGFTGHKNDASVRKHLEPFPLCDVTREFGQRYPDRVSDTVFHPSEREVRARDPATATAPADFPPSAPKPKSPEERSRQAQQESYDRRKIIERAAAIPVRDVLAESHDADTAAVLATKPPAGARHWGSQDRERLHQALKDHGREHVELVLGFIRECIAQRRMYPGRDGKPTATHPSAWSHLWQYDGAWPRWAQRQAEEQSGVEPRGPPQPTLEDVDLYALKREMDSWTTTKPDE